MKIKCKCKSKSAKCKNLSCNKFKSCKHNLKHFHKLYKNTSKYMTMHNKSYHKSHTRTYRRLADKATPSVDAKEFSGNEAGNNKNTFAVSKHDICNYLVQNGMINLQIQAIMKLDGHLDFDRLKKSVRLSVDAKPVLGCRLVDGDPPYWQSVNDIDEITLCSMEETNNTEEAVMKFLQCPFDMNNDTNLEVKIIRSMEYDTLGVKLNHACCDGTGTKEYIQLLSHIYSSIDQEENTFNPGPGADFREDPDKLYEELDKTCPESVWNPLFGPQKTMWSFPWIQNGEDSLCFAVCRIPQRSLMSAYLYKNRKGATLNDLILTAFYRSMLKISKPTNGIPLDILSTIDLRNYLPGYSSQTISNLYGGFTARITSMMEESFDATLTKIVRATSKIKGNHPDVSNSIGREYVENTNFAFTNNYLKLISQATEIAAQYSDNNSNICFPILSDAGYISNFFIAFGNNYVTDAYLVPPVIRAPGLMLLSSSYNGLLTLSISYNKALVSRRDMEGLLNKIKYELMRGY